MKIMADLDAVHLGLDENEADIAEELQDFDESFDTRSEASDSESSDSQPSISSVSTAPSSMLDEEEENKKSSKAAPKMPPTSPSSKAAKKKNDAKKSSTTKRPRSPVADNAANDTANGNVNQNGGDAARSESGIASKKKKRSTEKPSIKSSETSAPENATTTTTTAGNTSDSAPHSKKATAGSTKSANPKKPAKKALSNAAANTTSSTSNGSSCGPTTTSVNAINSGPADSFRKSDADSDAEDKSTNAAPPKNFESDSESEDSDSAANIKRNGRKVASKSISPEKKGTNSANAGAKNKSYDYMTKLNYLFRDTRFFLIKSNNADNIALSKSKNVWATLPQNDANLNQAFKEARNVLLIFSVNESGKFAGFARMSGQSRRDIPQVAWVLPPSISAKALGGVIEIDWVCRKELSFNCTSHLYNSWNEGKPVKIGRDGQEIEPKVGAELCRLFPEDEKVEMTPILRKSKETAKMMREKGIRVIYKPPRSLSTRGAGSSRGNSGFRNGNTASGGPMRHHKRIYGTGGPHRPYKMPPMGPPSSGYKRSSSPYRSGAGGPGGGSNNSRSNSDANLPPWERYITSAAAAEAYMADYMRTMHGQLPPLPFVPPFAQLPLPSSGPGSAAGLPPPGTSGYDQIPPPVRYYDGPPLPDYPPPQTIRPPPPSFDKPPTYEDFAAWKNAGLPTVPPPGFPGISASNNIGNMSGGSSSNSNGNSNLGNSLHGSGGLGGSNSGGGPHSYRNNRESSASINRARDRGGVSSRDYHARVGDRDRHFRGGGSERGAHRAYKDSRR